MTEEINFTKMRKELIKIYETFLKNPADERVRDLVIVYDRKYGGLSTYNEILKERPVPEEISRALENLSGIYQYGLGTLDDEELISTSKEILKNLKNKDVQDIK
jgi:hypothetical protein